MIGSLGSPITNDCKTLSVITEPDIEYPISSFNDEYYFQDLVNTWVRIDGSDVGYPLDFTDSPPCLAANWFHSKSYTPRLADYSYTNLTNTAYWGIDADFYILCAASTTNANDIANNAKTNHGIKGMLWDDFPTSLQSPANVSAIYTALHHEDVNLSQGPLSLIIVVYERDYFDQTPYTWASISDYFDAVSFWFYPDTYTNLWSNFYGYEDAFHDMRTFCGEDKEYWFGIYLHYYNQGAYPRELIYEQMGIALRNIDNGYATRLHILENQHIRVNPETSTLVKSYLESEYDNNFVCTYDGVNINSTRSGNSFDDTLYYLVSEVNYASDGLTFYSTHYQNVTFTDKAYPSPYLQEINTGKFVRVTSISGGCNFVLEPNKEYRLYSKVYTQETITDRITISTTTTWTGKEIIMMNKLFINAPFKMENCIVHWKIPGYKDSVKNATASTMGITLNTAGTMRIFNSTIQPYYREYPYYMNMTNETYTGSKRTYVYNSTIVGFCGLFAPSNYVYLYDSVFGLYQTAGATYFGMNFLCVGRINELRIIRNTFYNHYNVGAYNFVMPGETNTLSTFRENKFIGGDYPLWMDSTGDGAVDLYYKFRNSTIGAADSGATKAYYVGATGTESNYEIYTKLTVISEIGAITGTITDSVGHSVSSIETSTSQSIETLNTSWSYPTGYTFTSTYPFTFELTSHDVENSFIIAQYRTASGALYSSRFGESYLPFNESKILIYAGIDTIVITSKNQPSCPTETTFWVDDNGCISFPDMYIGESVLYSGFEYVKLYVVATTVAEIYVPEQTTRSLIWTVVADDLVSYYLVNLSDIQGYSGMMLSYEVYKNDVFLLAGVGPIIAFDESGNATYELITLSNSYVKPISKVVIFLLILGVTATLLVIVMRKKIIEKIW
jgi:hypothetical protein